MQATCNSHEADELELIAFRVKWFSSAYFSNGLIKDKLLTFHRVAFPSNYVMSDLIGKLLAKMS